MKLVHAQGTAQHSLERRLQMDLEGPLAMHAPKPRSMQPQSTGRLWSLLCLPNARCPLLSWMVLTPHLHHLRQVSMQPRGFTGSRSQLWAHRLLVMHLWAGASSCSLSHPQIWGQESYVESKGLQVHWTTARCTRAVLGVRYTLRMRAARRSSLL